MEDKAKTEAPVEKPAEQGQQESPPAAEGTQQTPQSFDAEYVAKLRKEAAKYRTEAKELATKAKSYDELQESQKTELQKAQEAASAAEKALQDAKAEAMRSKVAASKGLPPSIADRLRGSTLEEMEADADAVLAEIQSKYVAKSAPSKADTGAGVTGKPPEFESMNPGEMLKYLQAQRKGR